MGLVTYMSALPAPTIIAPPKHLYTNSEEDAAIDLALAGAKYNDFVLPLYFRGKHLGWVMAEPAPSRVTYFCRRMPGDPETLWAGFQNVDDIIKETTQNGKLLRQFWCKRLSGSSNNPWMHLAGMGGWPTYEAFAGAALTARQFDESSKPAIAHGGNVAPDTKHVISIAANSVANAALYVLYDLVLSYDRCTATNASQNFINGVAAQRYISAGQPGLRIMGLITTAMASGAGFSTLTYATVGGASHTIPNPGDYGIVTGTTITGDNTPYSAFFMDYAGTVDSMLCLPLATGDSGVASLTDQTMTATPASGEYAYLLGYPLAYFACPNTDMLTHIDTVKQMPSMARLYDGACPTIASWSVSGLTFQYGELVYAWG